MTIFGKKMDAFGQSIGKKLNYNSLRQFGNKIAQAADNGLRIVDKVGGIASNILGKSADVANGLGFGVIGTGLNTVKNIVDFGRKGVKGLEKSVVVAKNVGRAIDGNHAGLGKAIMAGDTQSIISGLKDVKKEVRNPLSKQ